MKRMFLFCIMFVLVTSSLVFAEASFDQIQGLIKEQNYTAAIKGLEVIIQNHPKSAKAFYAMSQAQAGIGNNVKAKEALDMATGLDPSLKFAPSSKVANLKEAIQPQTKKIESIESGHFVRNSLIVLALLGGGIYFFFFRKKKVEVKDTPVDIPENSNTTSGNKSTYVYPAPYVRKSYTKGPSASFYPSSTIPSRGYVEPTPHTTVVNNSSNDGLLTGILVGSMLNNHSDHTTNIIEAPKQVEVYDEPKETVSSSLDFESKETTSNFWEPAEEKTSSSWESSSSSSSSSSWDSSSSSSSSSSWDSGSSSSSDSSSSSSSWD